VNGRGKGIRERIAQEAARLIAEEGIADYGLAKRKAATHLGVSDGKHLPRNTEIEQALIGYQRLFQAERQPAALRRSRQIAVEAMAFLSQFEPRLVGHVLSGTAGPHSDIEIHLFADTPETVALFLMQHRIPYQEGQKRLRVSHDQHALYPNCRLVAGGRGLELTIFALDGLRRPPLSPLDGKPLRRASLRAVRELLQADGEPRNSAADRRLFDSSCDPG
jgi:hypothetical protein